MIDSIRISNAPSFDADGIDIGPFARLNYFYGANGAGKTTITRFLHDPSVYGGGDIRWSDPDLPLTLKVYNRDFVERTFGPDSELPGVFTLGEETQAIRDKIGHLRSQSTEIALELSRQRAVLGSETGGVEGKYGQVRANEKQLADSLWDARTKMPADLKPMFDGYNGSRVKLLGKAVAVSKEATGPAQELADLQEIARSVFDESAEEMGLIVPFPAIEVSQLDGYDVLSVSTVGSADVVISELIDNLGCSDWVRQGRQYLEAANGICPFCQQPTPESLAIQLSEFFDGQYEQQIARLHAFVDGYGTSIAGVLAAATALSDSGHPFVQQDQMNLALSDFKAAIVGNQALIQQKAEHPSMIVSLDHMTDVKKRLDDLVFEANLKVTKHNNQVRNAAAEREKLRADCWNYFILEVVPGEVARFLAVEGDLQKAVMGLTASVASKFAKSRELAAELEELEKRSTTSKRTISEINALLASVGFQSFHLAEAEELKGGYRLVRADGTSVKNTLSEGERSFVTFLYYFHGLYGVPDAEDNGRERVAVIDDPISSLDSDVLFVVSSLIRRLASDVMSGHESLKQLIVLTHNVYFHKEVTYERRGDRTHDRAFHLVRKRAGQPSTVIPCSVNPVRNSYTLLWDEIRLAHSGDRTSRVSLQNVMRRIIENYFRITGNMYDDQIVAGFDLAERDVCRSLFSWANDGSHSGL